ncbi:MAG: TRAP transporter fused permease subunit [Deltaproteobacteria bacterium]|nr:TRAP transporter fused permease subunit [Deltaproteobacteria bacterium]MBW2129031.1 TRAP transporter fused permease subunit [Deltaproteobacteria bacterium]MBW2302390.1 TRAP transporter fused permease subunit [Deltaproteobacteria bacterium]
MGGNASSENSGNESGAGQPQAAVSGAVERKFEGVWHRVVQLGMALTSGLVIYWTVNVMADIVIKRSLYLMLTLVLCAVVYPFNRRSSSRVAAVIDAVIVLLAVCGSLYIMVDYNGRFVRLSAPNRWDMFFGITMILIGLDTGRRVIGWSLTVVASATILYAYFGNYVPGSFGHPGFDLATIVSQVFCGLEGYYGMATKFMTLYVVPFIIMGAFLEITGAGDFFMKLAFSLTRRTVGGPAKAAVVGSAFMGSISGSAIANVSSTGVFTIPMMKRVGYRPHIAGAIEAAASTGGQIMPPIMGAVAFIMVEFTQIPYLTIMAVSAAPIILYFFTVGAFIHFEARREGIGIGESWSSEPIPVVLKAGWHFFLSLALIIITMALGYPPAMAALTGIVSLVVVHSIRTRRIDLRLIYRGLVLGGQYSLSIGSIVACIGIVLALVGLTGVGLKVSWLLSDLTHGVPLLAIIFVGLISMVLGMGLPAGPAYIVLAITAGPALTDMGFSLLVAHMIMIWYSIDSAITPPVGLASITAAGIARSDPMKTMLTAFKFAKGLYILPFMFYYRPAILLQGSVGDIVETILSVFFGLIALAACWDGYLIKKTRIIERFLLFLAVAGLLVPGIFWNAVGFALLLSVFFFQKLSLSRSTAPSPGERAAG